MDVRAILDAYLNVVETSILIGTMISTFELEGDCLGQVNAVSVAALPKFLTYRIPQLRGPDRPYSI